MDNTDTLRKLVSVVDGIASQVDNLVYPESLTEHAFRQDLDAIREELEAARPAPAPATDAKDLRLLSAISHVLEENAGRVRPCLDDAEDIVRALTDAGYAIVPAANPDTATLADAIAENPGPGLKDQLRKAFSDTVSTVYAYGRSKSYSYARQTKAREEAGVAVRRAHALIDQIPARAKESA